MAAVGAAPGLILMAAIAVLAAACSHGGNGAAGATSSASAPEAARRPARQPSAAGGAPADTSTPAASAVAVSGAAPPSASGLAQLPTSSSAAGAAACATLAAAHTFLYVTSATPDADGSLTVTGNHATVVCGGPDDYHYDFAAAAVTGRVLSGGRAAGAQLPARSCSR